MNQARTAEALEYLDGNADALITAVADDQLGNQPEFAKNFGAKARVRCLEDNRFHFHYLTAAITVGNTSLFADYCGWVKVVLRKRGIELEHLAENLRTWRRVLSQSAPAAVSDLIIGYVDVAIHRLPLYPDDPEPVVPARSTEPLVAEYIARITALDAEGARKIIEDRASDAKSVLSLYDNVLQPAQQQIGRLWQMNLVNVAVEHYATATAQSILNDLSRRIPPKRRLGQKLIGMCAENEYHCVGLQTVCDLARLNGWDSVFVGANTPNSAAAAFVEREQPAVVAVSVATLLSLRNSRALIARLNAVAPDAVILVGGYALTLSPGLWKSIGADAYAKDAASSIEVLERILKRDVEGLKPHLRTASARRR